MRPLERLAIDHRALYAECVGQTRRNADRAILEGLTDRIVGAGESFIAAARAQTLHALEPLALIKPETNLIEPLYESRLVARNGSGRRAYDQIKNSARFCPYCSFGEVYELDHFLARSAFPEFNICPANLVPVCHACNHIKLDAQAEAVDQYLLHPYFDRLPDGRWLFAELGFSADGPVLRFWVDLDADRFGDLVGRLWHHFETLQLDRHFSERAAEVLVEIESDLSDYFDLLGPAGLAEHFRSESDRHFHRHGNSLEAAAYLAAAENRAFCAGGYRN